MNLLLIDDNAQITLLLSKILINNGYSVTASNSFEEGLEVLRKGSFDAIIIDAPMPEYNQLNTITELERKGVLQSQKVILFTGLDIPNSKINELKTKGLYSYLKKPLEVEQLIKELSSIPATKNNELTEKRISEENTKKKFEDLRSNLSALKLKLGPT